MQTAQPFQIFGMSLEKCSEIQRTAPPGRLLATLAAEHLREEKQRESKATASAPVRPASTAPAAPTSTLSAQSLAAALLDEQDRRAAAAKIKTREQFTAMSPRDQMAFCKAGGKITV
jgi:hypothetical protein